MIDHDVIVIGAGPSGLQTARRLAQHGLDVVVLERKNRIGEGINCTGLIGTEVFDDFGLCPDSVLRRVQDVRLISPGGTTLEYRHPRCFAYVVDRERFDRSIGEKALSAGARIRTGVSVEAISQAADHVEIVTRSAGEEGGRLTARLAVIATGIHQDLNRKLGLGRPKHYLHGAQVETEVEDEEMLTIFAGNAIAAGGFAWAVPSRPGMVKFGLITDGDAKRSFRVFQERHLAGKPVLIDENRVSFKPIAQGLASQTYGHRILAVGEAAGQVKTTTGGGVAFGLRCAEIAADSVVRAIRKNLTSDADMADYERLWKHELKSEILLGYYARRIWSKMSDTHIERVFQFARQDGVIPIIREKGDFDRHGELILALLRRFNLFGILDGIVQRLPRLN